MVRARNPRHELGCRRRLPVRQTRARGRYRREASAGAVDRAGHLCDRVSGVPGRATAPSSTEETLQERAVVARSGVARCGLLTAAAALITGDVAEDRLDVPAAADERGLSTLGACHARAHGLVSSPATGRVARRVRAGPARKGSRLNEGRPTEGIPWRHHRRSRCMGWR